ncbi:MAG TPA: glycerate kinase [Anaerolineaceae bacterium]|nr:glycerate kinase [Anaerolineaceae bacterium]HQJ32796.1 glycerate kinase [Anaerolineaceae bacterium]
MKKIIVATDSFKGSLSALQACRIIAGQAERVFPQAKIVQLPISDGGEGLVEVIFNALGGERRIVPTSDPLGREISASYLQLADGSALIEMAGAGGLTLLDPGEYDPLRATTFGVGLIILHAVKNGLDPIYIGLGGSATVDGGTGAATALRIHFLDEMGEKVISGGGLRKVQRLDLSGLRELNYSGKLIFLTDVNNPLCGPNGAAAVFGPQKGATAEQVWQLDQGLRNLADLIESETGLNLQDVPGMGAAGGFALPFVALMGAEIRSGIDFVLDLLKFDEKMVGSDLLITGEGHTDAQSAMGKAISALTRRARAAGVRVAVISGALGEGAEKMLELGVDDLIQATPAGQSLQEALAYAAENLAKAAYDYLGGMKKG